MRSTVTASLASDAAAAAAPLRECGSAGDSPGVGEFLRVIHVGHRETRASRKIFLVHSRHIRFVHILIDCVIHRL